MKIGFIGAGNFARMTVLPALAAVKAPFNDLTFDPAQALAERCSQLWQAR
mgnify:CR=1 FL=1